MLFLISLPWVRLDAFICAFGLVDLVEMMFLFLSFLMLFLTSLPWVGLDAFICAFGLVDLVEMMFLFLPFLMLFLTSLPWVRSDAFNCAFGLVDLVETMFLFFPHALFNFLTLGVGRRGGLMVSVLDSGASAPGSRPGLGHCGASLHPGV